MNLCSLLFLIVRSGFDIRFDKLKVKSRHQVRFVFFSFSCELSHSGQCAFESAACADSCHSPSLKHPPSPDLTYCRHQPAQSPSRPYRTPLPLLTDRDLWPLVSLSKERWKGWGGNLTDNRRRSRNGAVSTSISGKVFANIDTRSGRET